MHTVTSKDGTKIAYEAAGTGPTVILIPPAFGDHNMYAEYVGALSPRFTVVTYDRRGHGESTDTLPYAVAREVEDIAALIEANGGKAFLFGVSSGAALGFEAASAGLPVAKLLMYEPPYSTDKNADRQPPKDAIAQMQQMLDKGDRAGIIKFFITKLVGMPEQAVAGIEQSPGWEGMKAIAHTLIYDAIVSAGPDGDFSILSQQLGKLKVPTMVADGGKSWPWIRDTAVKVAAAIPGAEHRTLPDQDHGAKAEAMAPVMTEFFLGK